MKTRIIGNWKVEGFYRYEAETDTWEYECEFRTGSVEWRFTPHTLTCMVDDRPDHTVTYTVARGNTLVIDYSGLIPHFNRYIESYRVERRGEELWLLDRRTRISGGYWLAIKLTPVGANQ